MRLALINRGVDVIIAHPERIPTFQQKLEPLVELILEGVEIQVNIGSILGKFGIQSRNISERLMNSDSVHYLASDAHGANNRHPPTKDDWLELSRVVGDKSLTKWCIVNPSKLIVRSDLE